MPLPPSHDRLHSSFKPTPGLPARKNESIPLTVRPSQSKDGRFSKTRNVRNDRYHDRNFEDEDDEDLNPDSDASYLRRHRADSDEADEDGDYDTYLTGEGHSAHPSPLLRFTAFMSKIPLLLRGSPALGTGSYGAVPLQFSETPDEQDGFDEVRQQQRREDGGMRRTSDGQPLEENQSRRGPAGRRRRRASTGTSLGVRHARRLSMDLGMGIDSKSTFATGSALPEPTLLNGSAALPDGFTDEDITEGEEPTNGEGAEDPPDNSPYAQVRASVPATDNTTLSISTPRMWFLSLVFALAGSATNLFFSLRYPSVAITPVIALVLVHPLGKLWDLILKRADDPPEIFENGIRLDSDYSDDPLKYGNKSKFRLWLGQGRWNEKEHACVYISSNVSFGFAFATDVIVEQHKFYKQDAPILYQILLTISTQVLGYAFAGLTRRFLVRPAAMIWPGTLMSTAMFSAMHRDENKPANSWRISRYKFFVYVWAGAFAWYFIPGLLMPALSYFNVITWFAPKNVVVANLFGVASGLGMFPLTLDWAQIAYIGSPLLTPWWAAANVMTGLLVIMWILAPVLYYKNVLYSAFMPMLSSAVFDNEGKPYDVSKILTADFLFDKEAYDGYSRVYLPITYVLSYGVQFAALSALVTHTICWHGKDILRQSKKALAERNEKVNRSDYQPLSSSESPVRRNSAMPSNGTGATSDYSIDGSNGEDVHCRLMRRYDDAPMSWYLVTFIAMLLIGIFVVEYYPVHLPWYGLLLALGITCVLFIPVGIVMAITNQHSSLYLICQLVCGMVFPGRPVANMVFVTYSYISSAQGIKFSSDLKLGHYMKIPPRILFSVQIVATLVSSFTQIGVLNWMFAYIPGICTPQAINGFNCPIARVHFNGSILWGVVGPQRFFGPGALYAKLVWAFFIGAVSPVIIYVISKRSSNKRNIWRKVNLPVLFGSLSWIPPATGLNFSIWAIVCFVFNYLVARRKKEWWAKYTMTLSAALDSGLAFGLLIVFFVFVYPGWMDGFKWWGTEVFKQGCDWTACSYMKLAPGEKFSH